MKKYKYNKQVILKHIGENHKQTKTILILLSKKIRDKKKNNMNYVI